MSADSVIHNNHQYGGSPAAQELQDEQTNDLPERHYPLRVHRAMSLTLTDFSTPDRGGDVVAYDTILLHT